MAEQVSARLEPKGRAGGPFGQDKGEDTKVSRAAYSFGSGYGMSAKACLMIMPYTRLHDGGSRRHIMERLIQ